jgi:MscS family membrane protein
VALKTSIAARRLHEHRNTGKGGQPIEIGGAAVGDWSTLLGLASLVFLGYRGQRRDPLRDEAHDPRSRKEQDLSCGSGGDAAGKPVRGDPAVPAMGGIAAVSIIARQILLRCLGVFAWIALAWFFARMIDAVAQLSINRLKGLERRQAVSVIDLVRRAAKLVLLFIAVVAVLDTFGIDVTTGVAALGIGGIALALGAQKTVENLVGSVTLIADKPVQVGDFCKVGDVVGTVEDVGIRSTASAPWSGPW